ncbi:hypothetical protein GCM10027168_44780 [Streptomyces capparidis]
MRVRVDVAAGVSALSWEDVHGPARGVVYELIGSQQPQLAERLHDEGWAGSPLKPVGVTSPLFRGAPRRAGLYTTSDDGAVWFGSPVPEIAGALVGALAGRSQLRWGRAVLEVRGFCIDADGPAAAGDEVELSTLTPVLLKHESRYLLPEDELYVDRLLANLAHKADVLGLAAPEDVQVVEAGPRRRFLVQGAPRIGATVRVRMRAEADFVAAIRSWGLGLCTVQGFGWVR